MRFCHLLVCQHKGGFTCCVGGRVYQPLTTVYISAVSRQWLSLLAHLPSSPLSQESIGQQIFAVQCSVPHLLIKELLYYYSTVKTLIFLSHYSALHYVQAVLSPAGLACSSDACQISYMELWICYPHDQRCLFMLVLVLTLSSMLVLICALKLDI